MRSILFIALACGQALMAAQGPTYEGIEHDYKKTYPKYSKKSESRKEAKTPRDAGKVCTVALVSAATFSMFLLEGIFSSNNPYNSYRPYVATAAGGAGTFAYIELLDSLGGGTEAYF